MKYFKVLFSLSLAVWCLPSIVRAQASSIALVQHTSKDAGAATSATLPFNSNNTAGNWIGVCIRAGYSGESFTVTDSNGNAYHRAAQFNVTVDTPNGNTLGIFYAENIVGGANTISVSDTISGTMRIAIVEYSGVATTNSLDVIAMAQGNGVSPNSGNATTTGADLLLGAISTANSASFTAGSGFSTVENVPRAPGTKLFVEQQIKTIAGTGSAQALLGAPDNWGAVLAAFKGGAGVAAKPSITSLSPSSGTVGTMVTITGANFGTALGTVTFNGTAGTPTTWSTTRIAVPVPSGATTGNVIVTDPGVPSNAMPFTVTPPDTTPPVVTITSPANNATIAGTATITASATDNVAVASVQFQVDNANSGPAIVSAPYSRLLNTTALSNGNHILTAVASDTSGNATTSAALTVNVNNTAPAPSIATLNPTSGPVGTSVTIAGTNFGATQGTSAVTFNGIAATATGWSATSITAAVPGGAATGNVVVKVGGVASNSVSFTVTIPAPSITSLNSTSGQVGALITIAGTNFGGTQGTSTVTFNGTTAAPSSWSATNIAVPVPAGATTGNVVVTVGGVASNGVSFTVTVPGPSITSLNPTSGLVGASVTISGVNFGATQGTSTVKFNGIAAVPTSWTATSIVAPVPAGATTGSVAVIVGGLTSNGVNLTVLSSAARITLVQRGGKDAGTTTSSSVAFNAANTAGNFIAVCIRAGSSGQAFTVRDSNGNTYRQGVQFNVTADAPNGDTLGIFYAENINGGANTITVSDTILGTLRFSILEYSGIATSNSLDVTATGQGTSGSPNSANAVTTSNGELLLSAVLSGNAASFTAGNGFVIEGSLPAEPNTKLIAEDQIQTAAGTVSAGAFLGAPDNWGVALAAFKAGSAGGGTAPSISSLNPNMGAVGTSVTITGANFGATQGTSTVKFNGTAAAATGWSATSITAAVPAGATTGNVVVTVGGVASNGVSFTVAALTPSIASLNPNTGAVGTSVTISGANFGATQGTSTVTFNGTTGTPTSWSATSITVPVPAGATTGNVVVGVSGVASNGVSFTVPGGTSMGPLKQGTTNPRYFVDPSGKAILLTGSQTWDTFQDLDQSNSPAAFDFTAYVNFLKSHGQNVTILWRKDLPTYCGWGAGGTWHVKQFPWKRTGGSSGTQVASDGLPAFDLTQLDQTYFDRLRARVIQLQQNGIYAVVELFDGLGLSNNRCSNDGYPFTGGNNVNGVDDGGGTNSMTMGSPNSITNYQDAFVQKVIDTINDQPNVLWEPSEEAPDNSTWWQGHMISLIHSYEAGKPQQHPVGYASLNVNGASDATLYNSNADWVAPVARISPTSSCGTGTPACKVNINDSDHSYFGMWTDSAQVNRNYVWENFANGNQVMFMDPYVIYWTSGNRNLCQSPSNGVCTGPDARWNNMRDNLGYTLSYANKMDLAKMTPQGNLSSTGFCLAQTPSAGAEYLIYAPSGGTFTVDLTAMPSSRVLNVEWFDPSSGGSTSGGTIAGGSTKSFTPPFAGDAVLYLVDAAGHN